MQNEFDWHYPSLDVQIIGVNEAGAPLPPPQGNGFITNGRDLPWLQDTDINVNGLSDIRDEVWQAEYRDVVIVDRQSNEVTAYNLTVNRLDLDPANYDELKQLFIEAGKQTPQTTWQQPVEPLDVDGDSFIGPLDALRCINVLPSNGVNAYPGGVLPTSRPEAEPFLDVNGDGFISPLDPLPVITQLTVRGPITNAVRAPLSGAVMEPQSVETIIAPLASALDADIIETQVEASPQITPAEAVQVRSIDRVLARWTGWSAGDSSLRQDDGDSTDQRDAEERSRDGFIAL